MKKILLAEVIVLVLLVLVAVFVRVNDAGAPEPTLDVMATQAQTTVPPTTLAATEPPTTIPPTTQAPTELPTQAPTEPPTEAPTEPPKPDKYGVSARQYFVFDCETGDFITINCEKSDKVYPASITKLFTAFVALLYVEPEDIITAGDELDLIAEDSSLAYVRKGHQLTAEMLVEGMLLPSGNDAAYVLAAGAARKAANDSTLTAQEAIRYFVNLMNSTANAMGMKYSHFNNPDGYHDEEHYTSLADLTIIARLALGNETIRTYTQTREDNVTYASGQTMSWKNTNQLINSYSEYYIRTAIGLKTGYTDAAGNCLLSAFREENRTVIIGVFGCPNSYARFIDTNTLYNKLIKN